MLFFLLILLLLIIIFIIIIIIIIISGAELESLPSIPGISSTDLLDSEDGKIFTFQLIRKFNANCNARETYKNYLFKIFLFKI